MVEVGSTGTNWTLIGKNGRRQTVAQVTADGDHLVVALNGETSTFMGPLEEAVLQIPALRTLEPGTSWTVTTDLSDGKAACLLGRPSDGIDGVEINGYWWELAFDHRGPFLVPPDWPGDPEFLELLFLTGDDSDYDWRFTFDREGPVCRLWGSVMLESGDEPPLVYEPDDLSAVERLAPELGGLSTGSVQRVWGPLLDRVTASERGQLVSTLTANASFLPAWWCGEELWFGSEPASPQPLATYDLEGALLAIYDETFLVGKELEPMSDSDAEARRVVMLPRQDEKLELLLSAAAALPGGEREDFPIRLEQGRDVWAGTAMWHKDHQRQIAAGLGALALDIRASDILAFNETGVRRWALSRSEQPLQQPRLTLPDCLWQ